MSPPTPVTGVQIETVTPSNGEISGDGQALLPRRRRDGRVLRCSTCVCCGLRANCCEVRLRGKTERDCERGGCSSRRYGASTSNRVGNGVRTRPHTPFEDQREGHIKRDCLKYKAQDQSLDTVATTVMAVDESDILLAASDNGKSDWALDSGNAYHLCRDREVFSTHAPCKGRIWMANNTSSRVVGRRSVRFRMADWSFEASGGTLRVSKGKQGDAVGKEDWRAISIGEECVQTGELLPDMGPMVLARRMDKRSNRCTEVCKASAGVPGGSGVVQERREMLWEYVRKSSQTRVMQPVQDVHREAQRKETKSILRSCTAKDAATLKRVSFALDLISGGVLSSCAHKGGEMEPRQLAKHFGVKWSSPLMRLRYLKYCLVVLWGSWIKSCQKGQLEDIRIMVRYSGRSQPPPSLGLKRDGKVLRFSTCVCCGLRADCCEGREIEGRFIKSTAIGVYLEESAVSITRR
ncbi:chalcone-flavanone isomerase family protein [Actinidia rufa]|uniref:Chalcone-flavanone isomerase family protein n=1 Tax=Actinidia rufa TaxID=165716 RepID=A0A7J0G394_9ERIC|nr:chalcone-flavanone isomerase family protein [Actinidia rufa]